MTKTFALLGLVLSTACAAEQPRTYTQWEVVSVDARLNAGAGGLRVADICDEQTSDEGNRLVCIDRARQFQAEDGVQYAVVAEEVSP